MNETAAFARALSRALDGDGPLPAPALPMPGAQVVIVAPPDPVVALALAPLLDRLAMGQLHRGRLELLLAMPGDPRTSATSVLPLRSQLGVRVDAHDPERFPTFPVRLADGEVVGVNDALRECEALVVAGVLDAGGGIDGLVALLTPGLADPATRSACGTPRPDGRAWGRWTADALGVELVVAFDTRNGDTRAWVGDLATIVSALAPSS